MKDEVARRDASYVLDWLRQTNAPKNISGLQECVVEALSGYVGPNERVVAAVGNRIENLELWSKSHPCGQRVEDKLEWAIDFIQRYGDFLDMRRSIPRLSTFLSPNCARVGAS